MTLKKYKAFRIGIAMALAALVAQAVTLDNYYLALAAALIAMGLMLLLKRQVKDVIADERDYEIAGKAARWSMTIFSVAGSIAVFILLALREKDPIFEAIGSVLAYSVCALLLLNSLIFGYLNRSFTSGRKTLYIILATIFISILAVAGLRLFSGEDDWICADGQWVEHGRPSAPKPEGACQ